MQYTSNHKGRLGNCHPSIFLRLLIFKLCYLLFLLKTFSKLILLKTQQKITKDLFYWKHSRNDHQNSCIKNSANYHKTFSSKNKAETVTQLPVLKTQRKLSAQLLHWKQNRKLSAQFLHWKQNRKYRKTSSIEK